MHKIFLNGNYKRIHFIGVGGISMSGLAEMLHNQGSLKVSGSDGNESKLTERLRSIGIDISIGHSVNNITDDMDLIVYTAAIKRGNVELEEARRRGIEILDRAGLLGRIMKNFKFPISVTGSHGKTSTTSMLTEVFISLDPTVAVGGNLSTISGNLRLGDSEYFIVEADEYYDSFLKFYPHIAVILNIDMDHSDYFKDYDCLWQSFKKFTRNVSEDGVLVVNSEILRLDELINGLKRRVVTYGGDKADWCAENVAIGSNGCASFDVFYKNVFQGAVGLNVVGYHNVSNALAVFAAAHEAGLDSEKIAVGLRNYNGVDRRFQVKGEFNGVSVIDDYAHHPTEIKATLAAARNFIGGRLCCVFQPHTYSRTKYLLDEFAHSFKEADLVIITDIFAAREADNKDIHSRDLTEKIRETGKEAYYFESFADAEEFIVEKCSPPDMLITMGAGNVYLLAESLVNRNL